MSDQEARRIAHDRQPLRERLDEVGDPPRECLTDLAIPARILVHVGDYPSPTVLVNAVDAAGNVSTAAEWRQVQASAESSGAELASQDQ